MNAGHAGNPYPFSRFLIATMITLVLAITVPFSAQARQAFSAIAVDANNGRILFAKNPDSLRYPASMTKMMTLYLIFEDLRAGRIKLGTRLRVSAYAASRPPSKLGFRPGATITVRNAIKALVTKSANDVAVAVAENLNGSVANFARRMTRTARRIGMTRTTFVNPSGLPNRRQLTTARDMATLALRLQRDFPRYFRYFSTRRFTYRGRRYGNHNRLLGRLKGVNGIKTGYTRASGYNLTTSVTRGNKRLVAVVIGSRSGRSRNAYMAYLVNKMFARKRLASSRHIALTAGRPPGYRRAKATRMAKARLTTPPLPRSKPDTLTLARSVVRVQKRPRKMQDRIAVKRQIPATSKTFSTATLLDANSKGDIDAGFDNDPGAKKTDLALPKKPVRNVDIPKQPGLPAAYARLWTIQIGAFPTKSGAKGKLESATRKAARNLRNKYAYTMPVKKGAKLVYRARFAGFNKKAAVRACRALTKRGFGCFALAPAPNG